MKIYKVLHNNIEEAKSPFTLDAVLWTGDGRAAIEIMRWLIDNNEYPQLVPEPWIDKVMRDARKDFRIDLLTLDGHIKNMLRAGSWLIKEDAAEFFVVPDYAFDHRFKKVSSRELG